MFFETNEEKALVYRNWQKMLSKRKLKGYPFRFSVIFNLLQSDKLIGIGSDFGFVDFAIVS
jgi:hypothetical protein